MLVSQSSDFLASALVLRLTFSRNEQHASAATSCLDSSLQEPLTHVHSSCLVVQGGSIFSKIRLIVSEPSAIPEILGSALTTSSNFFIDYVIIQVVSC